MTTTHPDPEDETFGDKIPELHRLNEPDDVRSRIDIDPESYPEWIADHSPYRNDLRPTDFGPIHNPSRDIDFSDTEGYYPGGMSFGPLPNDMNVTHPRRPVKTAYAQRRAVVAPRKKPSVRLRLIVTIFAILGAAAGILLALYG